MRGGPRAPVLALVCVLAAGAAVVIAVSSDGRAMAAAALGAIVGACGLLLFRPRPAVEHGVGSETWEDDPTTAVGPWRDQGRWLGGEFLDQTLRGRIAIARRALRPVSVVHVEVDGLAPAAADDLMSSVMEATLRESDVIGRRADGVYVFILEDTGEDGAVWTAERLRRNLGAADDAHRFRAGVASYPNHGLDVETIEAKASAALAIARDWPRDRIEVATGPDRSG